MHLLVTGATGFLGFRTLEYLAAQPWVSRITATGRTLRPTHTLRHPAVTYTLGDLTDASFVRTLFSDVDAVVHAAALSSPWGPYADFFAANVLATRNVLSSARDAGVMRFVHISTPSVYVTGKSRREVRETDPLPSRFVNAYAATKYLAEQEVAASGLPWITFRPRALVGRGDTVIMPRILEASRTGRLRVMGRGDAVADLTAVDNVAYAIGLALQAPETALHRVYNLTNGTPVRLWDVLGRVLEALGTPLPKRHLPVPVAYTAAFLLEQRARFTPGKEPVLTRYGVGTLTHSFTLDISEARLRLGYNPPVSIDDALQAFLDDYRHASR